VADVIRAHIYRSVTSFGVDISIVQHFESDGVPMPEARQIMRLEPVIRGDQSYLITQWEPITPGEETQPTLRLADQEAIALMTALVAQYQGVDDQRMLRRDYDAERGRVDKLVDAVTAIAQQRTAA
jgi:hypothetical protein